MRKATTYADVTMHDQRDTENAIKKWISCSTCCESCSGEREKRRC
jgi:hypothetical protein